MAEGGEGRDRKRREARAGGKRWQRKRGDK
jgi:hypothetical protein